MMLKVITSNPGKVKEYQESFDHLGIEISHQQIHYDEVQSSDLEEVVQKGMNEIKRKGVSDFIIDDSGLFIDGLNGFPGVWSAYAQKTIGNKGILKLMDGVQNRSARFKCCIGCNIHGNDVMVTGICEGVILDRECGNEGFGFDPVFSHDGSISFAEMPTDMKNTISHRGNAVRLLMPKIEDIINSNGKP